MFIAIVTTSKRTGEFKVKKYKVTVSGASGEISYEVCKTLRGANGFAKKLANEAFFGEEVTVTIKALQ
jgi:hypothetical protein